MFTKIKSLFMVLILAGFTAQYAAAESFNQEDMAFAFGDSAVVASDFGQMDLLSSQEMMETEGEYGLLGALFGGGLGAWNYLGYSLGSGRFSWSGLGYHVGGGAALGAIAGPMGMRTYYYSSRFAGAYGFGSGYGSRSGQW